MITTIEIDGLKFTGHEDGEITIERINELRKNFVITNQNRKAFDTFLAGVKRGDDSKVAGAQAARRPARVIDPSASPRASVSAKPKNNEHPKRISKDDQGWGVDIKLASGDVVRYFYGKRDEARSGIFSDEIGIRGRVA